MPDAPRNHWTNADFSKLSWHDNHIHGFRIVEGEHGAGDLELDIDHILAWLSKSGGYQFVIAPATLRFFGVTNLRIELDYVALSAGIVPPAIHVIEREDRIHPNGCRSYSWRIAINWPEGEFTFDSPGFDQTTWGETVRSSGQWLSPGERVRTSRTDGGTQRDA